MDKVLFQVHEQVRNPLIKTSGFLRLVWDNYVGHGIFQEIEREGSARLGF